ncbi:hypothetical protein A4244_14595 [Bacillus badius]|nr:hypothetical protein A4244_14595 [Bacillus badius]OCS88831.1 hypothetical protein A6M11_14615 [Bacillus badius]
MFAPAEGAAPEDRGWGGDEGGLGKSSPAGLGGAQGLFLAMLRHGFSACRKKPRRAHALRM